LADKDGHESSIHLFKAGRKPGDAERRSSPTERLVMLLEQSATGLTPRQFSVWCALFAITSAVVGFWMRGPLGLLLLPIGSATPIAVLFFRRHAHRRRLCRQLPEAFQMISRAVRAGQTVPSALKIIVDDFDAPICEEFALCYEQQN